MKKCNTCGVVKPLSEFHRRGDKHQPKCKQCKREWSAVRYSEQKDRILANSARWRSTNSDRMDELRSAWNRRNPRYSAYYAAYRRCRRQGAIPPWVDMEQIKRIYSDCPHDKQVDHIIPLKGKRVCGLHVPENLQYLDPHVNSVKANTF